MPVTVTNAQALEALEDIRSFFARDAQLPQAERVEVKPAYWLNRTLQVLQKHVADNLEPVRLKLLDKYGQKDAQGKLEETAEGGDGRKRIKFATPEDGQAFVDDYNKILLSRAEGEGFTMPFSLRLSTFVGVRGLGAVTLLMEDDEAKA